MYSIGEFSTICRLSIKALRHYDSIGLLKPAKVDPDSGYRYYGKDQVDKALMITRLKSYAFKLAEIAELLNEEISQEEQLYLLKKQRDLLKRDIVLRQGQYNDMNQFILSFERTGNLMTKNETMIIEESAADALPVFEIRKTVSMDEMGTMFSLLFEASDRQGIFPEGPVGSMYHDEEFDRDHADTSVFFVCDPACANASIPGGRVLKAIHKGGYSTMGETYATLTSAIEEKGLKIAGSPYELYLKNQFDRLPVDQWETAVCFPVK